MTSTGAFTPRRTADVSPLRRLSRTVLIIGTVVAVLAAFGPTWVVRIGVLVAVAAGIVATVSAWRELAEARRTHAAALLAATKTHGAALSEERRHNSAVVDTLTARARDAAAEITRHRNTIAELTGTIGQLQAEVVTVRADHAAARGEIRRCETTIASLRETVRAREAELIALSESAGQVRAIPRRVLAEHESDWEQLPDAAELWADGTHPAVVDLREVAVVLPNYEGERRFA